MLRTHTSLIPRILGLSLAPRALAPVRLYSDKHEEQKEASAIEDPIKEDTSEPEKNEWQVKFEAKDKEAAKFKEAYQKSIADFRNLQNTTQQEVKKSQMFALQKFAKDLIESVDNFDLAMKAFPKDQVDTASKDVQEFYQGVAMVQQVLEKTLSKHGITKVNPLGEKFDPNEHEALFQQPHETEEPGTIIHVDRTGFKIFDRVIRAPKVGFVKDPIE